MSRGALTLMVLTLLASAVNYGSNLVFSRMLSPASYGDLTSLLALSVVIAVPSAAAQTRMAERVAHYSALGDHGTLRYMVRHAVGHLSVIAVAAMAVYLALLPAIEPALNLQAPGPALALAPLIGLSVLFPLLLGTLQGMHRFLAFGLVSLAVAVARLAFGVPWVEAGGGSGGAILGQALGMALCFVVALWLIRGHMPARGSGAGRSGLRRRLDVASISAGLAFVGFAVISNLDIVLAKLFLDDHEAGLYGALFNLGKAVTFLPAAIAVALVPAAARARADAVQRARALRIAALGVIATALVAALPAAIAPELVLTTMFGEPYGDAAAGVLPIVCAGAALSLIYLIVVFAVAIEDRRWAWLLVGGVALQVVGIALWHETPTQVAAVQGAVAVSVLLANELLFHSLLPRRRAAAKPEG